MALGELGDTAAKGARVKVPKSKAKAEMGRHTHCVCWVGANKGDEHNQNYRSRLVARQLGFFALLGEDARPVGVAPGPPRRQLRGGLAGRLSVVAGLEVPLEDHLRLQLRGRLHDGVRQLRIVCRELI